MSILENSKSSQNQVKNESKKSIKASPKSPLSVIQIPSKSHPNLIQISSKISSKSHQNLIQIRPNSIKVYPQNPKLQRTFP